MKKLLPSLILLTFFLAGCNLFGVQTPSTETPAENGETTDIGAAAGSGTQLAGCIDENKINPTGICTMEWAPVCGCDGITYGNQCGAANAGVTSSTPGECGTGGEDVLMIDLAPDLSVL